LRRLGGLFIALVIALATSGIAIGAAAGGEVLRPVAASSAVTTHIPKTPIQHVVVIFQENHSFDNVLGGVCVNDHLACDGTTTGVLHDGTTIPLAVAHDIVPVVAHYTAAQNVAVNGGAMNGFDLMAACNAPVYKCYSQFDASEIPNLRTLAESYVISDRTFSESPIPSWGGHMDLIAGQTDGFVGDNPTVSNKRARMPQPGWGCDSRLDAQWKNPADPSASFISVPACVPRGDGFGPYRPSPVAHIPTILDRLTGAGLSWSLYSDVAPKGTGYIWSICPTFASCLYDKHNHNQPSPYWKSRSTFTSDVAAGRLPSYSVILPSFGLSQHNGASMLAGDNYIQRLVSSVMNGPPSQWASTAIFITYDDCGCFYDHVAPPAGSGLGIRVPMVIVSPQAKASFVDSTQASYNSMLAFVEKNWALGPLTAGDRNAYDYCNSFVFTTLPCTGPAFATHNVGGRAAPTRVKLRPSVVPKASIRYTKTHHPDPADPT
jgi:phospholipase C